MALKGSLGSCIKKSDYLCMLNKYLSLGHLLSFRCTLYNRSMENPNFCLFSSRSQHSSTISTEDLCCDWLNNAHKFSILHSPTIIQQCNRKKAYVLSSSFACSLTKFLLICLLRELSVSVYGSFHLHSR